MNADELEENQHRIVNRLETVKVVVEFQHFIPSAGEIAVKRICSISLRYVLFHPKMYSQKVLVEFSRSAEFRLFDQLARVLVEQAHSDPEARFEVHVELDRSARVQNGRNFLSIKFLTLLERFFTIVDFFLMRFAL